MFTNRRKRIHVERGALTRKPNQTMRNGLNLRLGGQRMNNYRRRTYATPVSYRQNRVSYMHDARRGEHVEPTDFGREIRTLSI